MSEHLNRVTRQYLKFRDTKTKLRRKYRAELKKNVQPDFALLGKEISEARNAGFKVEEIMIVMGLKNRNFMYDALKAYEKSKGTEGQTFELPETEPDPDAFEVAVLRRGDTKAIVTIGMTRTVS